MPKIKPTGEQLANTVRHADYDPDFLVGFLTSFVGNVADGKTVKPARAAARDVLESLAAFEAFVASCPPARRRS